MSGDNWKTLRVPPEAYDQAKAQKEEHGRTWGEQIVRDNGENGEFDTIVDAIKNELSMANDPDVQIDVQRLYNRLDDLESSIPSKTVDELEARQ